MSSVLASPNTLTRAYASVARQLAAEALASQVPSQVRERAVGAVTLAVASVETYLNVFAQLWIDQSQNWPHKSQVEQDLRTKKGLGRKIEDWPQLFFGRPLQFGSGPAQKFKALVALRNRLMHFLPETRDLTYENVVVRGMIDIEDYESLTGQSAKNAIAVAEGFVAHLLELQGIPCEQRRHALHHWLGTVPSGA